MKKIEVFNNRLRKLYRYNTALNLINWDMLTKKNQEALDDMVEASTELSLRIFKMKTCESMGRLLNDLLCESEFKSLSELEKNSVRKFKKEYDEYKNVPVDFYKEYKKTTGKAQIVWANAKNNNDFNSFKPYLKKMIEMSRQMVKYQKPDCKDIYNKLINDYEEGFTTEIIDGLFSEIKEYVINLVKKLNDQNIESENKNLQNIKYPIESQKKLSVMLLEYIGFDLNRGELAESEHPFTMSISFGDTRLTDHYYEKDFINPMFSIIHEGGHGIFEQGVDEKYKYTPMEIINYLGLHESQSRFYENILGKNINFWKPVFNKIKELMPEYESDLLEFDKEINKIKPNPIRINSDEVSYCLHIILRYEIEKELFAGNIDIDELPKVWNDKMNEYLGILPKDDSMGVLQDSHWSSGSFGYFPTYLIGSIYDGMILEKIEEDLGDVDEILESGKIKKITKWLNKNIHQYGASIAPMELIEQLCNKPISSKPLIKYFKEKYE